MSTLIIGIGSTGLNIIENAASNIPPYLSSIMATIITASIGAILTNPIVVLKTEIQKDYTHKNYKEAFLSIKNTNNKITIQKKLLNGVALRIFSYGVGISVVHWAHNILDPIVNTNNTPKTSSPN